MGYASRNNPTAQNAKAGKIKPKRKQLTVEQKIAQARIDRFQAKMRPKGAS